MKKTVIIFVSVCLLLLSVEVFAQKSSIKEEKQMIKTYPFGGPEAVPIMARSSMWGRGQKLYPYFFYTKMSHEGIDQAWNIVTLENPFIKVLVLPDNGGKIHGAYEKSTENEFIYHNEVRKFRQIALRGPWTSGGIEPNFGIRGHQATTSSPVDYVIRENPDGSVSCFVGTIDLPSRMYWTVNITLSPDKAYFETKSLYYNPTPYNQPYYVWMNAANRVGDDLEFIYPGTSFIGHNYSVPERPWPGKKQGLDLSMYKNHKFSDFGSLFINGVYEDFNGCYWHDSDFGFGHWALYDDMPGQKFFRWSLARSGAIWEDLLTDTDGQYYEPQFGRLFDQDDAEFAAPYVTDHWKEIWFPYKEIGPMVKASPYGALNVTVSADSIQLGFCALQNINEDIVVFEGSREVFKDRIRLGPMEIYTKAVPIQVEKGNLRIEVGNKLKYSDDPEANVINRPLDFMYYDESSLEQLYLQADRYHKARDFDLAMEKYLDVLDIQPLHIRALTRVAELNSRQARYDTALRYAKKALTYAMYDPDANYIYGVVSRAQGNLIDAKETFGWAARSMHYRSTAYCQMAEIYLMEKNLNLAEEYINRSLDYDVYNIKSYQIKAAILRISNQFDKAAMVIDKILEIDPLNHLARFERYILDPTPENRNRFTSMIRNELPHETYLETAMFYVNLGLEEDALQVLGLGPEYAVISYWQAYLLRNKDPQKSRKLLQKAVDMSSFLVFPFREEAIPMFQWAKDRLPDEWKTKYYLGLVYWGKGRYDDAKVELAACGQDPDYAPFYIARGFLSRNDDPNGHVADFEKAFAVDPEDWQIWHQLISLYNEKGMAGKALTLAREAAEKFSDQELIAVDLARAAMNNKLYQECYDILNGARFLPYEGQRDVHRLFAESQIYMALENMNGGKYTEAVRNLEGAKQYPEKLGTGRPKYPDFRLHDYLMGLCYDRLGKKKEAQAAWQRIFDYSLLRGTQGRRGNGSNDFFSARIFEKFGEYEKSFLLLQEWKDPPLDTMAGAVIKFVKKQEKTN